MNNNLSTIPPDDMSNPISIPDILKNLRVVTDPLRDVVAVTLYYNGEKVGKMEYRKASSTYQGDMKILTLYSLTPEFMELFKGQENPIRILDNHVKVFV
jgi:hypothetical protein